MSTSKLRHCLFAIPALLTLVALTVPPERLPRFEFAVASAQLAGPPDEPCMAPETRHAGRKPVAGRKLTRD